MLAACANARAVLSPYNTPGFMRRITAPPIVLRYGVLLWIVGGFFAAAPGLGAQDGIVPAPADAGHSEQELQRAATPDAVYAVGRATGPIRIDGVLDEPVWSLAEAIPIPIEVAPGDNVAAPVRTDCRVAYDAEHFYLGCVAYDPDPTQIRAYITDRDGIFGDNDRISMLLDPFNDRRRGFVFEVSPLGVQADLVYDERTSGFDANWDGIWESAGRITSQGYQIEAAIPFGTLRFPSGNAPQRWRFWINRMRPRSEFAIYRTNTRLRGEDCQLCQAHLVAGLEGMHSGRSLEVVPTLTGNRTEAADAGDPLMADGVVLDAGIDARWSLTTNLAWNATVNPDFSQVEADAPQLDANNPFALPFPEKRPFFLEGADLFETPVEAVFTRTIADPIAGTKLTGKFRPHAAAALAATDDVNNLIFPGPFTSDGVTLDQRVHTTLARYRRDIRDDYSVGALYTGRFGEAEYANHVVGVDAFLRPTPEFRLNVQGLLTRTRYPDEIAAAFAQPVGGFTGQALDAVLAYRSRSWGATVGSQVRTAGARLDAGFMPQADARQFFLDGSHTFWGDGSRFSSVRIEGGAWHDDTTSGELLTKGIWSTVRYEGPLQSESWVNPFVQRRGFREEEHALVGVSAGFRLRPSRSFGAGISSTFGEQIDFRNGGKGDQIRLSPSVDLRIGRGTALELSQSYQRLARDGATIFSAHVAELAAVYNVSTRAFGRLVLQYRRTRRNPETNPALTRALDESLFAQALLSYKVNPLTVVFLGMTDDRSGFEDSEQGTLALAPTGRRYFFKIGYAWRS